MSKHPFHQLLSDFLETPFTSMLETPVSAAPGVCLPDIPVLFSGGSFQDIKFDWYNAHGQIWGHSNSHRVSSSSMFLIAQAGPSNFIALLLYWFFYESKNITSYK